MKKSTYTFIICMFFISACATKIKNTETDWTPLQQNLSSTKMLFDTCTVNEIISTISLIDDNLFFVQIRSPERLTTYTIKNDSLLYGKALIYDGDGPYDTRDDPAVTKTQFEKNIITTAGFKPKIFTSPNTSSEHLLSMSTWHKYDIEVKDGILMGLSPFDDEEGTFYGFMTGHSSHFMFYTYKVGDPAVTPIKHPYPNSEVNIDSATCAYMYLGRIYKRPNSQEFVYCCPRGRYSYIFTIKDNQVHNPTYIYNSPPKIIAKPDANGTFDFQKCPDTPEGYSVIVTQKYLYYIDRTHSTKNLRWTDHKQVDGNPLWFSNIIYVYDWTGNPVRKYVLDRYIENFTVSSDDKIIYANAYDVEKSEVQMLKFHLDLNAD